jgi:hypothetical protein
LNTESTELSLKPLIHPPSLYLISLSRNYSPFFACEISSSKFYPSSQSSDSHGISSPNTSESADSLVINSGEQSL